MKRILFIIVAVFTCAHPLWALYEYSAAPIETIWEDDDQQFISRFERNDPPHYIRELFGGYYEISDAIYIDLQIAGKENYSKELRIEFFQLVYGHLFDFSGSLPNSFQSFPISIQLKNKTKFEGLCQIKQANLSGGVVGRAFEGLEERHQKISRVYVTVNFSDLHCKNEPSAETLDHETFIGQALYSSDIKSIEFGKGNFKVKFNKFSTHATLYKMLQELADCTDETDIYFPNK